MWGSRVYGLDSNLAQITFAEGIEWIAGDATSFDQILADPNAVIISEGLSEFFERGMGDTLRLHGQGLDHVRIVRIVGIMGRFSGFNGFTSKRTWAEDGRTELFLNETAFRELTRDPLDGPYDPTFPIFERLMAAPDLRPGLLGLPEEVTTEAIRQVATDLRKEFGLTEQVSVRSAPEDIESARGQRQPDSGGYPGVDHPQLRPGHLWGVCRDLHRRLRPPQRNRHAQSHGRLQSPPVWHVPQRSPGDDPQRHPDRNRSRHLCWATSSASPAPSAARPPPCGPSTS